MKELLLVIGVAGLLLFGFVMYVRGMWGLWFERKVERTDHLNYHELREREMYRDLVDRRPTWQSREDAERLLKERGFRPKR